MGLGSTLLLGLIAGATILLGLPIGRIRRPAPTVRALLNAVAIGVLLFLVWDVLSAAWEPIDTALGAIHEGTGGLADAVGYGLLFAGGLAVGLLSLVAYEQWMARVAGRARAVPQPSNLGPGAAHVTELPGRRVGLAAWTPARRLALLIAVGIGLHNFAEGLAIGQSAASGEIALATLLVIGFALHNATEGFGITAPLAGDTDADGAARRPSWGFLLLLGLIGGGPTFVGTPGRARVRQRAAERRLPDPGRGIDHLRDHPAPRGGRQGQATGPARLRPAHRVARRVPHRCHRLGRRRLTTRRHPGCQSVGSPAARTRRDGLKACRSRVPGGSATPGPPATAQAAISSIGSGSRTSPSHTGRPPARRPAPLGLTMTTFECSQASRQSVIRSRTAVPLRAARSAASCPAWSVPGCLARVPQQQPRHTVTSAPPESGSVVCRLSFFRLTGPRARRCGAAAAAR